MPRGRHIPIVFFGEPAAWHQHGSLGCFTRLIEQPATPAMFSDIIIGIDRIPRVPPKRTESTARYLGRESTGSHRSTRTDFRRPGLHRHGCQVARRFAAGPRQVRRSRPDCRCCSIAQDATGEIGQSGASTSPKAKISRSHSIENPYPGYDLEDWDPFSRRVHYPNTAAAYSDILLDIATEQRLPPLTSLDRPFYRKVASQVLAPVSRGG